MSHKKNGTIETRIERGQTKFGQGPFVVEGVTTNVVIILRNSAYPEEVAVMNMGKSRATESEQLIKGFIEQYEANLISRDEQALSPGQLEAIVIGGEFRRHEQVDEGFLVYVDSRLARINFEQSLGRYDVRKTYLPEQDILATKSVKIDEGGNVHFEQMRLGLNRRKALKSKEVYDRENRAYDF